MIGCRKGRFLLIFVCIMARHSHWHNIQATKGKADARRAKDFGKLAKAITVAAKEGGGDPSFNFSLRMAMDSARLANVPKENVERAVARGIGEGTNGTQIDTVVYEGFGPGGLAVLIQCLTDNRNRSFSEVRTVVQKNGGTLGTQGSVMWMFEKKGVIVIHDRSQIVDMDGFELSVIEAGADDIRQMHDGLEIVTHATALKNVSDPIGSLGFSVDEASLVYLAKEPVDVSDEDARLMGDLIEKLEALDDVDTVYTNER